MSAEPVHHFAPSNPSPASARPAEPALQVDRRLHHPHHPSIRVEQPEPASTVVPLDRSPRNRAELDALIAERTQQAERDRRESTASAVAAAAPVAPPSLAPSGTASPLAVLHATQEARRAAAAPPPPPKEPPPVLPPQNETEARARLADAIRIRDAAQQAVTIAADAMAKAKAVEADAEAKAATSGTVEMRGADTLAEKILLWATSGGARPDLGPDADSVDARRDQIEARVHADAARQAARALEIDLHAKRAVADQAERAVTQAAGEVVSAMIEDMAVRGAEAQRVYEQARMASRVVYDMGGTGAARTIRARPTMQRLGQGGMLGPAFPETPESGPRQKHFEAWSGLLKALASNPNAALG
ncbi:hypothetical protein MKL09_26615 [Methylobacterium sp. J-048]|uniref:hypothetical protein n=1 Tax=Methylobacterium sp. J-048 TaxID=2836635 RepID=UPI001FBA4148|nr:hypothetical protein [Methylobacterium sp. J-048]MCJ2060091.1 hypothetical protein [Methylobacterium sp. J-048]